MKTIGDVVTFFQRDGVSETQLYQAEYLRDVCRPGLPEELMDKSGLWLSEHENLGKGDAARRGLRKTIMLLKSRHNDPDNLGVSTALLRGLTLCSLHGCWFIDDSGRCDGFPDDIIGFSEEEADLAARAYADDHSESWEYW